MAAETLWFGTLERLQEVQMPPVLRADRVGYFEGMVFENGGAAVARSAAHRRVFEFNYPWGDAYGAGSIDVFNEYRSGEHGSGLIYFADPSAFDTNLFEPRWASPRLVGEGWENIYVTDPSWGATNSTAVSSYSQPALKGTWSVTTAANATPLTDSSIPFTIIPIHPDYTLHIGCTGAATGTAVVRVESWVNGASSAGATSSLTLLPETGSTRMNATVSGSSYAFAKVYITRTSSAASTITPISMMAQLWPTGVSPTLTGAHVRGKGHSGLRFEGDVQPETYTDASSGRHYKALSFSLVETGAWE